MAKQRKSRHPILYASTVVMKKKIYSSGIIITKTTKPKKVKIVQSLNNHYHQLKGSISNFCSENDIGVKWIHWRSSSAGLCIKLDDDRIVSKIHSMTDFNNQINSC